MCLSALVSDDEVGLQSIFPAASSHSDCWLQRPHSNLIGFEVSVVSSIFRGFQCAQRM